MKDFDIYDLEWMAARFTPYPLHNSFLDVRYAWQKESNGVEWPYYRFFYHLTVMLRPTLTVELGGYQGTAAAHLAGGWPKGRVVSVDHHTDEGDQFNQGKMVEATTEFKNLKYYQGWTTPELAVMNEGNHALGNVGSVYQSIKDLTETWHKIDILFIDSWHVYEYARLDYEAYLPLMNSPGLMIFDDIQDGEISNAPIRGMMRFWRELPEPKFLNENLHPGKQYMGFLKV